MGELGQEGPRRGLPGLLGTAMCGQTQAGGSRGTNLQHPQAHWEVVGDPCLDLTWRGPGNSSTQPNDGGSCEGKLG